MTETLYSYLLQHRSLPIPGLGSILIERVPAQNDFVHKKILPPTFHFRFDKYFDAPDKEFFTFLAIQENVADYEAIRKYNEWAFDLRNALRSDEPVSLGILGTMYKEMNGEIGFKPSQKVNAFFSPVNAVRITPPSASVTVPEETQLPERLLDEAVPEEEASPVEEVQENWKWYIIGMVTVIVLILVFHFLRKGLSIGATGLQPLW
jgi:hypothetical protein